MTNSPKPVLMAMTSVVVVALVAALVLTRAIAVSTRIFAAEAAEAAEGADEADVDCDARRGDDVTDVFDHATGRRGGTFIDNTPSDEHTFDARGWTSHAYGVDTVYPFSIGKGHRAVDTCVLGGTILGSHDRSLTWRDVKREHDGDALRIEGSGTVVVDGLRADNVEDGISPHNDEATVHIRGVHLSYVRDDCLENDDGVGVVVSDTLFDGCFVGVSERSRHAGDGDRTLTLDRVLMRLERMPYDTDVDGDLPASGSVVDGGAHGQLFKWSQSANDLVIRDSVFLVPGMSANGAKSMAFPPDTRAENVTLVWLGPGEYPAQVPDGVTITRDAAVWERARAAWLQQHGATESVAGGPVAGS